VRRDEAERIAIADTLTSLDDLEGVIPSGRRQ
jgi:hypothetical protein